MATTSVITDIVLYDERDVSSGNPHNLWDSAAEFAAWAMDVALLEPGEFPEEALLVASLSRYVGQVMNGGHWQFAHNTRMDASLIQRVQRSLEMLSAQDYAGLFTEFQQIMASDLELLGKALSPSWRSPPEAVEALDDRFYALDLDGLIARTAAWLRTLPSFTPLSRAAVAEEKAAIKARNRNFDLRQAARQAQ
ncbi:MAG TPA: DUF4375 domain-containing protein [Roseomonas sp.]